MDIKVTVSRKKYRIIREAITEEIQPGQYTVASINDNPADQTVTADIIGIGVVSIDLLSGENYDAVGNLKRGHIISALQSQLNLLPNS